MGALQSAMLTALHDVQAVKLLVLLPVEKNAGETVIQNVTMVVKTDVEKILVVKHVGQIAKVEAVVLNVQAHVVKTAKVAQAVERGAMIAVEILVRVEAVVQTAQVEIVERNVQLNVVRHVGQIAPLNAVVDALVNAGECVDQHLNLQAQNVVDAQEVVKLNVGQALAVDQNVIKSRQQRRQERTTVLVQAGLASKDVIVGLRVLEAVEVTAVMNVVVLDAKEHVVKYVPETVEMHALVENVELHVKGLVEAIVEELSVQQPVKVILVEVNAQVELTVDITAETLLVGHIVM